MVRRACGGKQLHDRSRMQTCEKVFIEFNTLGFIECILVN